MKVKVTDEWGSSIIDVNNPRSIVWWKLHDNCVWIDPVSGYRYERVEDHAKS